jgi:hypothetical protein
LSQRLGKVRAVAYGVERHHIHQQFSSILVAVELHDRYVRLLGHRRGVKNGLLPKWFVLPSTGEAHSGYVNVWKFGKKRIYFGLHVIVG